MSKNTCYDIIPVFRHLTAMLEPIARAQGIGIYFINTLKELPIDQDAAALITGLTDLLYKIINYTSENNEILISIEEKNGNNESFIRILIANTGTNLLRVTELKSRLKVNIKEGSAEKGGTLFEIDFPVERKTPESNNKMAAESTGMPAFYAEIRKRFVLRFSKAEHLVATLSNYNPREAAFLKKVNALIVENIGNPQMDANYISNAMHMSRTQLFRRLKPIIRQSPGSYIKTLKLQKAKELFETTDLRINEVAYKTGFESPSHFTKAFVRHFGVKPSLFCRNKMQQMSK